MSGSLCVHDTGWLIILVGKFLCQKINFTSAPFNLPAQILMSAPSQTSVSLGRATTCRACSAVSVRLAMNWTEVAETAQVRRPFTSKWVSQVSQDIQLFSPGWRTQASFCLTSFVLIWAYSSKFTCDLSKSFIGHGYHAMTMTGSK